MATYDQNAPAQSSGYQNANGTGIGTSNSTGQNANAGYNPNSSNNGYCRVSRIADPGPLGLFAFASTTWLLSLYSLHTRGVTHPNIVVGMGLTVGGLAQLLAGMWEFPRGNAFWAAVFTLYGAFYMSLAVFYIPGAGVFIAFPSTRERNNALGLFLITWFMVTFFILTATIRKSISHIVLFFFLTLTFILSSSGELVSSSSVMKAGASFGLVTALIAFYMGTSKLLRSERASFVQLPVGVLYHEPADSSAGGGGGGGGSGNTPKA